VITFKNNIQLFVHINRIWLTLKMAETAETCSETSCMF